MGIDFKYEIGDIVYFCLDYQHVYKAKVYERYASSVVILYNVSFSEDGKPSSTWLPEEALYNSTDDLLLELE